MPKPASLSTVTWRQAFATMVVFAVALTGLIVVLRSDGLPAIDAAASRATRWVAHSPSGRVVLVDGFGGRALASLEAGATGDDMLVADGRAESYVLDDTTAEVRLIDSADLRLGAPRALGVLGSGSAVAQAGSSGLLVADPTVGEATLLPTNDEPVDFDFAADTTPGVDNSTTFALAPDGSIWSIAEGSLRRTTSAATTTEISGLDDAAVSLVNNDALVLDRAGGRARLGSGGWHDLPTDIDGSELVVQRPGPAADCGWIGGGDELWCVSESGLDEVVEVPGLDVGGGDLLAIAGDAAALVRRGPTEVVQFDWRTEEVIGEPVTVDGTTLLDVTATTDVIWIDDVIGDFVWTVHPWGIHAVDKDDSGLLLLGEEGDVVDEGDADDGRAAGADDGVADEPELREPDDNGVDDPPVAIDDPVTARSGASVPVAVTANDYDPDGEAVAIDSVGTPEHGAVDIGTATTVVYTPEPGYVGRDEFGYTIVDGNGNEASARVIVELLPVDGTNRAPVGAPDNAETGPGVSVIVDVLVNDLDPERDGLRLDSFSAAPEIGTVTESVGRSGLPALEFDPVPGFEGAARFSYRPVDTFGAIGEPVEVTVDVASPGDPNRRPRLQPDAVRTRRNTVTTVPVLLNDSDPDGDPLVVSVVTPLPDGLDVEVQGEQLAVTALAGSGERVTFEYEVDDGRGHRVRSSVLVVVIDENEPNRPPVVSADLRTAVLGQTILIDVTANDFDPDGDPLAVVGFTQPESGGTVAQGGRNQLEFTPSEIDDEEGSNVRFTYTVSDGNAHEVNGEVTVTVLAEPLPEPPFARDDSTFTFVDDPVTIDVLRNDGDPSGGRPTLVGQPGCPAGGTA
ncbi:Ig-like domain-containing protein, partial [Ilumatobacter nonamiensis]|uniref:Ig-like domain-containing protein n=1 Tax=Ilumatobacter nonamiensis TaxID=467093 RepID=UPI0011D19027